MRALWLGLLFLTLPARAPAAALTNGDVRTLRAMLSEYTQGWLNNDRHAVMSVLTKDAVFIPHDGVKPHIGFAEIDKFWFPGGKPSGTIPAFTQTITDISGADSHATMYGRNDLTWVNGSRTKSYRWIGNFLIVARKAGGRWMFTYMMASDEQPKIEEIGGK